MRTSWRSPTLAAVLSLTAGAGLAAGQSVALRNAPPGTTLEFVLNGAPIGTATVDANGDAIVTAKPPAGVTVMDAHVLVDACDKLRRVLVMDRNQQPPAVATGCDRQDIPGIFLVRRVSTVVINVGGPLPTLLLRQGSVRLGPPRTATQAPSGLVVFGGGGFATFGEALNVTCGNANPCEGKDLRLALSAGVDYWFTRVLAAEVGYLRPSKVTASGSGDNFDFDSTLDVHVLTLAGKVGAPVGPVRFYGRFGASYHRATFRTTETIDDLPETETVEGGTQTLELKTQGWSWLFGAGLEAWLARSVAIYGEGGYVRLKGSDRAGGEGRMDDNATVFVAGMRVRLGG